MTRPDRACYDALVLGGGPAGAATALSLVRRGHTAALVESAGYGRERIGETLAPPGRELLAHLGVGEPFFAAGEHVESYATRAVWGDDVLAENPFVLSPHGRGWQLDRRRFDALLVDAACAAGTDLYLGMRLTRARRIPGDGAGWRLEIEPLAGGTAQLLKAMIVVDATGRGARFALAQGARKLVEDRLVGVCGVVEDVPAGREPGVLVEACRDGWWYSALLPRERALVAFLGDADHVAARGLRAPTAWAAALRRSTHTRARIAGVRWPLCLAVRSARTQRLDRIAGRGWLAVGDAAATVDPLSSQGILKALRGGIFASYAIGDALGGDAHALGRYTAFVAAEHDDNLAARAHHYGAERRWADAPFWFRRRRSSAMPIHDEEGDSRWTP